MPGAYTFLIGERIRIWRTSLVFDNNIDTNAEAGCIIEAGCDGIMVKCGDRCILVKEIQLDCCKRMTVDCYIRGHQIDVGEKFGTK